MSTENENQDIYTSKTGSSELELRKQEAGILEDQQPNIYEEKSSTDFIELAKSLGNKNSIVNDTKIAINNLEKELGIVSSTETPPSIKIEEKLISKLETQKDSSLYKLEFEKSLELSEYPELFTEIYQSAVRVLENENNTDEEKLFAQKYLERLTKSPDEESSNEGYDAFYQESETNKLKERVFEFNQDSILHKQREILGIDEDNEKTFDIKVLAPEDWDSMNFMEKEKWWKDTTECPSLFVRRGFEDGKKIIPTIFLSKDDAESLMEKDENDKFGNKGEIQKFFQHEYRHTQRKFGIENDNLFRFIDEPCTNVGFYKKQALLLDFLGMTTDSFKFKDIKSAYESGSDESVKAIFKKMNDALGDKGVMLIGSEKSSEHTGDKDGISGFPLLNIEVNSEEDVDSTRFLETLLSYRAQNDSNWLENFQKNINPAADNVSRGILEIAKSYLLRPYFKHAGGKDTPHLNKFLEIIDSEIERRKALGEEGF